MDQRAITCGGKLPCCHLLGRILPDGVTFTNCRDHAPGASSSKVGLSEKRCAGGSSVRRWRTCESSPVTRRTRRQVVFSFLCKRPSSSSHLCQPAAGGLAPQEWVWAEARAQLLSIRLLDQPSWFNGGFSSFRSFPGPAEPCAAVSAARLGRSRIRETAKPQFDRPAQQIL